MKGIAGYDVKRAFTQYRIWVGVIVICVVGVMGAQGMAEYIKAGGQVESMPVFIAVALEGMRSDLLLFAVPILVPLSFAASFIEEIQSRFYLFSLPRAGRKRYFIGKAFLTLLSGGLCAWLGGVMLTVIIKFLYPVQENAKMAVGILVVQYIILFLNGSLWALVGGVCTILLRSRYMAYTAPFIIFYVLSVFQERYYSQLYFLSPKEWARGTHIANSSCIIVLAILCCICLLCYIALMKRRVQNV